MTQHKLHTSNLAPAPSNPNSSTPAGPPSTSNHPSNGPTESQTQLAATDASESEKAISELHTYVEKQAAQWNGQGRISLDERKLRGLSARVTTGIIAYPSDLYLNLTRLYLQFGGWYQQGLEIHDWLSGSTPAPYAVDISRVCPTIAKWIQNHERITGASDAKTLFRKEPEIFSGFLTWLDLKGEVSGERSTDEVREDMAKLGLKGP